jgi:hypothetical protein
MKWKSLGVIILTLFVTGLVLQPVQRPAWEMLREKEPALDLASLEGVLGQGITVGLLGGFRALVANFMWLRVNETWQRDDLPATQTFIQFVTTIDPRPLFFWLNGSRMIGYDMPVWRIREVDPVWENVPRTVIARIEAEQATVAIGYLHRGLNFHPDHPLLYVEIANLYQRKMHDLEMAAEYYRRAATTPNPPLYAGRIYAELLRRLDRHQEAYDWLVKLYPTLNPHLPSHRSDVVLQRIRDLEDELGIPPQQQFDPPFLPDIRFE